MEISVERLKELESLLDQADRLWKEYQSIVLKAFELWHDIRGSILNKIAELQGLVEYCKEKVKEIDVKAKIGLIEEEEASKLSEEIRTTLDNASKSLNQFEEWLNNFNSRVEQHLKIVILHARSSEIEEIKSTLGKVEELYKEGKISEALYNRLKIILKALKYYA